MDWIKAVDLSGPSTGWKAVPREWFRQVALDHDIHHVNVGLWTGAQRYDAAVLTLANARAEGWSTSAYYVVHDGRTAQYHFDQAKAAAGIEWPHLRFISVDVEDPGPVNEWTAARAFALLRAEGFTQDVLYSSSYMWRKWTNNAQLGPTIHVWNAYYDSDPDIDFASAPWGGISVDQVIGEQYSNTTDLYGIGVDFDVFRADFINKETPMTPEDRAYLDQKFDAIQQSFDGVGRLLLAAYSQINEIRERGKVTAAGLGAIQQTIDSLTARVNNSIGGNPGEVQAAKEGVTTLARIVSELIAAEQADQAKLTASADELKASGLIPS